MNLPDYRGRLKYHPILETPSGVSPDDRSLGNLNHTPRKEMGRDGRDRNPPLLSSRGCPTPPAPIKQKELF